MIGIVCNRLKPNNKLRDRRGVSEEKKKEKKRKLFFLLFPINFFSPPKEKKVFFSFLSLSPLFWPTKSPVVFPRLSQKLRMSVRHHLKKFCGHARTFFFRLDGGREERKRMAHFEKTFLDTQIGGHEGMFCVTTPGKITKGKLKKLRNPKFPQQNKTKQNKTKQNRNFTSRGEVLLGNFAKNKGIGSVLPQVVPYYFTLKRRGEGL